MYSTRLPISAHNVSLRSVDIGFDVTVSYGLSDAHTSKRAPGSDFRIWKVHDM